jgi:hypothetical protein
MGGKKKNRETIRRARKQDNPPNIYIYIYIYIYQAYDNINIYAELRTDLYIFKGKKNDKNVGKEKQFYPKALVTSMTI